MNFTVKNRFPSKLEKSQSTEFPTPLYVFDVLYIPELILMKENLAHGALCTPYRLIIIFRVFLNKSKLGLSYIKTKQGVV